MHGRPVLECKECPLLTPPPLPRLLSLHPCAPVALVLVVSSLVLIHNARHAHRQRTSLKGFPALVPELLLAVVKATAYGYVAVCGCGGGVGWVGGWGVGWAQWGVGVGVGVGDREHSSAGS